MKALSWIAEVALLAERLRVEEDVAAALCDDILTGPPAWWPQRLRKIGGTATAGMVRALLARMRTTLERSPENALRVTALALDTADALPPGAYPPTCVVILRAQALRDHGRVLCFLGRHSETLDFAARAQALLGDVPGAAYELARVAVLQALALQYTGRADEAVTLARQAAETFLRHGDRTRSAEARVIEGSAAYNAGAVERALAVWQSVEHDPGLDEIGAVRVAHNIALCQADLRRPGDAVETLSRCIAQFERFGMPTERTRSRAVLGHAQLAAGQPHQAIPILRQTRRELLDLGLVVEAGLAALDLAEALLTIDQPAEVPALCRDVIAQFTAAGMSSAAMTALSFLREAAATGHATPILVRTVRRLTSSSTPCARGAC